MDHQEHVATFARVLETRRAAPTLVCLQNHGPMRWTEARDAISKHLGVPVGDKAATRALRALETLGLVERPGTGRNRPYILTPAGKELARWAHQVLDRLHHLPQPNGHQSEPAGR